MSKERLTPHQKKMLEYERDTREAKLTQSESAKLATNRITKQESHKKLRAKIKQMVKTSPADSSSDLTAARLESLPAAAPKHKPQVSLKEKLAPEK
ncbi:MAG: hypothetical protein ACREJ2_13980 [Planctomycetota bacterium]